MPLFQNENKFNSEILSASQKYGVPVSIIKGFVALESNFDPKSYRYEEHINDASYGLMQILFKTAKGAGYTGAPEGLYDPKVNVEFGTKFLRGLLEKYPDLTASIAAYNMGYPRKAEDTTAIIRGVYGKPQKDWTYANQPYVDRVAAYIAYYQKIEKGDVSKANEILELIKKKECRKAQKLLRNPFLV
jgi:soluble lytic murein transglycosylase-like protein